MNELVKTNSLKKRVRSRNWCFTDQTCNSKALEEIGERMMDIVRYIGWSREIGDISKKVHLQGWIQMIDQKDFWVIKELLRVYHGC